MMIKHVFKNDAHSIQSLSLNDETRATYETVLNIIMRNVHENRGIETPENARKSSIKENTR